MAPSRSVPGIVIAALVPALVLNLVAAPAFAHEHDEDTPTAPVAPVPAPSTRPTPWPFVLVGVGALTLGTGVWLVHRDDTDTSTTACNVAQYSRTTCPYSTASHVTGWAFVALGAELAVAGAVWRLYQVHRARKSVSVIAGLGSLGLAGRF